MSFLTIAVTRLSKVLLDIKPKISRTVDSTIELSPDTAIICSERDSASLKLQKQQKLLAQARHNQI